MKSRVQRGRERLRAVLEELCVIALDVRGHLVACEPRPRGERPRCACDGPDPPLLGRRDAR